MAGDVLSPPITTNGDTSNTELATHCVYSDADEDDYDPLGILGGGRAGGAGTLIHAGSPRNGLDERCDIWTSRGPVVGRHMARPIEVDCGKRDPREVIDMILRNSKDIRHRVSSRQVSE